MKNINGYIWTLIVALLVSCTESVKNAEKVERLPDIYPDYIGVTIPAGIAPMDFNQRKQARGDSYTRRMGGMGR